MDVPSHPAQNMPSIPLSAVAPPRSTPTEQIQCTECHKTDHKIWMCKCSSCNQTFHSKCVPDRKLFQEVLCHDCLCPNRQLEIIRRLRRQVKLLRDEQKMSDALIKLYQQQCDHYKDTMDHVIRVVEEGGEKPAVPEKE